MAESITFDGFDRLQSLLVQGGAQAAQAVGRALYEESLIIFAETQREVPVMTGALRSSGQVKPPQVDGEELVVEITYGGAGAPYGLFVHENLDASHDSPTKAKYLEGPVTQAAPRLGQKVAERIDRLLKGAAL